MSLRQSSPGAVRLPRFRRQSISSGRALGRADEVSTEPELGEETWNHLDPDLQGVISERRVAFGQVLGKACVVQGKGTVV